MRSLTVIVAAMVATAATAMTLPENEGSPCDGVVCKAGRECIVSHSVAQCLCVTWCPDHDNPVCGSDGESYDNYCQLHQQACIKGKHVRVQHKGYCQKDIDLALKEFGITTTRPITTTRRPTTTTTTAATTTQHLSVCYGPQRDSLRDHVIAHWQTNIHQQPWATPNMTYRESLSGHFFNCDKDRDYVLRPTELLDCFKDIFLAPIPHQEPTITKALCVDALIEDVDANSDYKLTFQEFTQLLDPLYKTHDSKCSLERKDYPDGHELTLDCNHCVCATGNWVCAPHPCKNDIQEKTSNDDQFGYMDTKYDLDNTLGDSDQFYDDEDYEDDLKNDIRAEQAKTEFDFLSSSDKKKLTHLENNIKKFYAEVAKSNHTETSDDDLLGEDSDEETSSEEEDELLDQYDELLEKSESVREKLTSLRDSIRKLEEKRNHHHNNDGQYLHNDVHINSVHDHIDNHRLHPGKTRGANKRKQKHDEYRRVMQAKLDSYRQQQSITDNDIWEDQWKAKIKKHRHYHFSNQL